MGFSIHIPDDLAERLETRARAAGVSREDLALRALRRELQTPQPPPESPPESPSHSPSHSPLESSPAWARGLEDVQAAFEASGMSEDEAVELFEAEKHAMRRERRDWQ